MAQSVSPETTVYVLGAGGGGGGGGAGAAGSGVGAVSSAAAGATSGSGACALASGAAGGASVVLVLDDHAGPPEAYSTRLRSSCSTSLTSLLPLVSVCHTGLSE